MCDVAHRFVLPSFHHCILHAIVTAAVQYTGGNYIHLGRCAYILAYCMGSAGIEGEKTQRRHGDEGGFIVVD